MNELNKFLMTDIEDIPEAEVSSFEKKQMKKRLLGEKRRAPWLKKLAVAASIFIAASATTIVAFPSLASQIPILQNIVSYFDENELIFNHFSEVAQPLGLTETSNGSTVTIEEAVYDGTSVTISFALKTETELGDYPIAAGQLEAAGAHGSGSAIMMDKVNSTTYAGMITMAPDFLLSAPNTLRVSWEPISFEDAESQTVLTGDWSFNFKLKALDSASIKIGESFDFNGGQYTLDKLWLTKLSTVLTLTKKNIYEFSYMTEWQLKDNLGNSYSMQFGTGSDSHQQFTFEAMDPEATSVTITPLITQIENPKDQSTPVELPSFTVELK